MINNIQDIKNKYGDIGGINGTIYAAEPLAPSKWENVLNEYQKGVEVWTLDGRKSWLVNGHNDTIPYLHRLLYRRSSIHNSAVNIIGALIYGGGLDFYVLDESMVKNQDGYYEFKEMSYSDSEKENLMKQARVIAKNVGMGYYSKDAANQLPLYGGYYGIRDYALTYEAQTRLRSLRIEKYFNMRLGAEREFIDNRFQSTRHFISSDWTTATWINPKKYADIKNEKNAAKGQVYYIPTDDGMMFQSGEAGMRSHFSGRVTDYRDFYATPIYETLDALAYIDIDYMLSQKDFKDIQSGFALEHLIVRYRAKKDSDELEAAEKQREKTMFRSYKGFDGEKTMILWVAPNMTEDGRVETPDTVKILTIPNENNAERYNVLREERNMKILSAHNIIAPELIGMPPTGNTGFSSQSEYLITAMEQLHWAVVDPYRELIKEDLQGLFANMGLPIGVRFKNNAINYRRASETILQAFYGANEVREKYGDGPMSDEVAAEVLNRVNRTNNNNQR